MNYSVKGRAQKVNRLFYQILLKFLLFKIYSPFLSKSKKERKLQNLHSILSAQISNTFLELEGLFLKFAQQLSTMSSLLPKAYITQFEKAQNNSTPHPFSEIKERIEFELNSKIENVFLAFDEQPIGTASIGQVHKAVLLSGESVAVKVQHLNIEKIADLDLKLIQSVLKKIQYFIKIPGLETAFEEVSKMILEELDYKLEAQRIQVISDNLKNNDQILIPKIYSDFSTQKVLVMEFMDGHKITDDQFTSANSINKSQLAKNLLNIFSRNIFIDGLFHADPHPGNILVNKNGQLILLDFGAVGIFEKHMKEGLIILMQAALLKDENLMIAGFKKMGFISNEPGIDRICKKIIRLLGDFLVDEIKIEKLNFNEINLNDIDLSKAVDLLRSIDIKELEKVMKIPKDWVLLNRTIALVIGISSELAPQLDVLDTVKPNLLRMVIQKESLGMIFKNTLQQQALRMVALPRKMELFLEQAENGEIEIKVKNRKIEIKLIYVLVHQVLFAATTFLLYYFFKDSKNSFFFYSSLISLALFIRSFSLGIYYKRKLND